MGLHTNEDVEERRGSHLPIMDVHERCLSLLACKYVDEVIIGKPQICLLWQPGKRCPLLASAAPQVLVCCSELQSHAVPCWPAL